MDAIFCCVFCFTWTSLTLLCTVRRVARPTRCALGRAAKTREEATMAILFGMRYSSSMERLAVRRGLSCVRSHALPVTARSARQVRRCVPCLSLSLRPHFGAGAPCKLLRAPAPGGAMRLVSGCRCRSGRCASRHRLVFWSTHPTPEVIAAARPPRTGRVFHAMVLLAV